MSESASPKESTPSESSDPAPTETEAAAGGAVAEGGPAALQTPEPAAGSDETERAAARRRWLNWLPFALFIWVIATVILRIASDSEWWLCALGGVGAVLFISPGPAPAKQKKKKRKKRKKKQTND